MGGFLNVTGRTNNRASESEIRCGQALAGLVPTKWMVVAKDPSGHRGAIGGSTADFEIRQGGYDPEHPENVDLETIDNETLWGTVDAYTPQGTADKAADTVREKLSQQASKGVIVDLANFPVKKTRDTVINKIVAKVKEFKQTEMVIFHYNGENRFYNSVNPFPKTSKELTFQ
jgi:hypothetical protein